MIRLDLPHRAQNMPLPHGKVHRINEKRALPCTISAKNTDTPHTCYASGFRDLCSFGFDLATVDQWIGGEVQSVREEV